MGVVRLADLPPEWSRQHQMLGLLAPDLVKAAIEGCLPHGMGVVRLADLPAEWSRHHQMLGLAAQ
jgi:site-specific DNA recombinase